MNCPKCQYTGFIPDKPCPECAFNGDAALIEELAHVDWILNDLRIWGKTELPASSWLQFRQHYETRKKDLEVNLGLRLPRFTEEEAQTAWPKLFRYEILDQKLSEWLANGDLDPEISRLLAKQLHERAASLTERLADHPRPTDLPNDTNQLEIWKYLLEVLDRLSLRKAFTNPRVEAEYRAFLQSEIENLEIKLGLRAPAPVDTESPKAVPLSDTPAPPSPETIAPATPPPPKIPLRERFWRSLLSERTLHAILFLGIFLLFTAAVSFVIWGWQDFSAPLRVAIPTGFTLLFFGLGWFVRTKTALYRSGIALSAIAALLIPIDFYTLYVNFGTPPANWAEFWLIASLICIFIYIAVTLTIQSRFFGYLVIVAAGSAVLAAVEIGYQYWALSQDWASAAISALALTLILLATALTRLPEPSRWRVFVDPFRHLALLAVGVIMPLTLAWRYLDRVTFDTLHTAISVNWWIGGLVLGWGAIRYRSRGLGLLAIISLPVAVYLTQAGIFDRAGINPAWQAFGLACLAPLYFFAAYRLSRNTDDPVLLGHSRSALGCGIALLVISALWSLTDLSSGAAAASSHAVLAAALVLTALLWQRPRNLYGASFFSFTAVTFAITQLGLAFGQSNVGWASLALLHIFIAVYLGNRGANSQKFSAPLVIAGYVIAGLSVLVSLYPYEPDVMAYTLGNWLVLAGWGAYLANREQPGFSPQKDRWRAIFHWGAALPLPIWLWILFDNRAQMDFSLPLAFSALSWGMFALGLRVGRDHPKYRQPWNLTSLFVSIAAPVLAFTYVPDGFIPAICLLASGLLYFADAIILDRSRELAAAGFVTAWGFYLLLYRTKLSFEAVTFSFAILVSIYIFAGLWAEWRKRRPSIRQFLAPLYMIGHLLAFVTIFRVYLGPLGYIFGESWTDTSRMWGAATQILLGLVYLSYAWGAFSKKWAHLGVWLLAFGGGFIVIAYSSGRGRSAALVAVGAIALVISERVLNWLRTYPKFTHRQKAGIRLVSWLYSTPLLTAGWTISVGAIVLALYRNLVILGGGRPQQIWAALGLLLITGLYALSARLFRRMHFVVFAGVLSFFPWTILTNLGWFTPWRLTEPGFAVSWIILAGLIFLISLRVARWDQAYALPLQMIANFAVAGSLLWAFADNQASRYAFALAIMFYGFAAWLDHRRAKQSEGTVPQFAATRYLYPALALVPIWFLYILGWLFPGARIEHYGLLLLLFAPFGLAVGQWIERRAPQESLRKFYGLPAYLVSYIALCIGTDLVAILPGLLSIVLLYDAVFMLVSAWLFRAPLWLYPAVVLVPFSLWISLDRRGVIVDRRGWWLIGLSAIYLSQAWLTRRARLTKYSNVVLSAGLILIMVSLPASSQDEVGAFWGYLGAVILYTIAAFWLHKPLGLALASLLAVVPYAVAIRQLGIPSNFYGLALFPGAVIALALGWLLDLKFGAWDDFPWSMPRDWLKAIVDRFFGWWALPLYLLGFGFACLSPFFAGARTDLMALNFALMVPIFGWAIYRFRLRFWLAAMVLAIHFSWAMYLDTWGLWWNPADAWQRFAPVTVGTLLAALWIQNWRKEEFHLKSTAGWSQVLYSFVFVDVLLSQLTSLDGEAAGAVVSLVNALVIAVCASAWYSRGFMFFSTALGAVALAQGLQALGGPVQGLPVAYAYLALGYGVAGYLLTAAKRRGSGETRESRIPAWLLFWESPLQISGLMLSFGVLILTIILGFDLAGWFARALMGLPFREIVDLITVQMVVRVGSILGLLYLATSIVYQRLRVGYLAVGMLLGSWVVYAFYIQEWDNLIRLQGYAIPAGLYLLGVAYLEWGRGNRTLSRWLDYIAMVLMLGSLFWQTLVFGWTFALMMGAESLAAIWWGSARRLRRFFYTGIVGVVLATIGQLLNALQHINQWVTFGIIGLLLVAVGIIVERQRERLKLWQDTMEDWE